METFSAVPGIYRKNLKSSKITLLYCLGKETEDILALTNIGEEDRKNDSVLGKFDSFFSVRKRDYRVC